MNRRSFLSVCIATLTAPAIVRASSLMPVSVRKGYSWEDTLARFYATPLSGNFYQHYPSMYFWGGGMIQIIGSGSESSYKIVRKPT